MLETVCPYRLLQFDPLCAKLLAKSKFQNRERKETCLSGARELVEQRYDWVCRSQEASKPRLRAQTPTFANCSQISQARRIQMKNMFKFLTEWERNDSREWMSSNKLLFMDGYQEFNSLLERLALLIETLDPASAGLLKTDKRVGMIRDERISETKPLRPAYFAQIRVEGQPIGYRIYISHNNHSFLGGGLFSEKLNTATKLVRDYIASHEKELDDILCDNHFASIFEVKGTSLKYLPREYPMKHPQAQYLKLKNWFVDFPLSDALILSSSFPDIAESVLSAMKQFLGFLNRALEGYEMPEKLQQMDE
jgi:uncharacterized protein (TIGR02453 family)